MSSVGNILLEKEILLESGTNELEILVFRVEDISFGINVAKVREVLTSPTITNLPKAHQSVMGVFQLRDAVVPCVSLHRHLNLSEQEEVGDPTLILTDFNNQQTAFVVDSVERIHRMSWEKILAVPAMLSLAQTPVTAVARIEERLIIMLDFEMISDQVTEQYFRTDAVANPLGLPREELRIVLADDSATVREAVTRTLKASGYTNLRMFENGALAWNWLEQQARETDSVADLVVSDVEMPQIDGFHLTKKIKEHPKLRTMPVLLYSSIVSPDNYKKGAAVGADAQVSKPELGRVVELADELISKSQKTRSSEQPQTIVSDVEGVATPEAQPAVSAAVAPAVNRQVSPQTETPTVELSSVTTTVSSCQASKATPSNQPWPADIPDTQDLLWYTFRSELSKHLNSLQTVHAEANEKAFDREAVNSLFRTLHTIKSSASVVPVEAVVRTTHAVEGLFEGVRDGEEAWPAAALENYMRWLRQVADPVADLESVLGDGQQLCSGLTHECCVAGCV